MNIMFINYLDKFVLVFIDDDLVYSKKQKEHEEHLRTVLHTLREHQLYAKFSKFYFQNYKIEYLGHVISKRGIFVDPKKVEAILNSPIPKDVSYIRSFMGNMSYYIRFIEGHYKLTYPIIYLQKKGVKFEWKTKCQESFEKLKYILIIKTILKIEDPKE